MQETGRSWSHRRGHRLHKREEKVFHGRSAGRPGECQPGEEGGARESG